MIDFNSSIGINQTLPFGTDVSSGKSLFSGLGGFFNDITGKTAQMEFDHNEAQLAREWEQYVAQNKYLWAKEGIEAAGLNPYLMYGSMDASTSSGPVAHSSGSTGYHVGSLLSGIASVIHATGSMASTMNSKHEIGDKLKAYYYANKLLDRASKTVSSSKVNYSQRKYSDEDYKRFYTDLNNIDL